MDIPLEAWTPDAVGDLALKIGLPALFGGGLMLLLWKLMDMFGKRGKRD